MPWRSAYPRGVSIPTRAHADCVVECATCAIVHRFDELAADVLAMPPRYFLCPLCRGNLVEAVREHLETCPRSAGVTRPA
jgi:hypothetical protein